jgi:hypothetical protein
MGKSLKFSRKILYRSRSHPSGIYIQALFSALDFASRTRLSEPAAEDPVPGFNSSKNLRQPACASRKACSEFQTGVPETTVSHLMPALLPIRREAGHHQLTWTAALSASILVNLLTVADHEQIWNLPMPGYSPQWQACVSDWSRKRDRPVVTIATPHDVGAITEAVSAGSPKTLCAALPDRPAGGRPKDKIDNRSLCLHSDKVFGRDQNI